MKTIDLKNNMTNKRYLIRLGLKGKRYHIEFASILHFTKHFGITYTPFHKKVNDKLKMMTEQSINKDLIKIVFNDYILQNTTYKITIFITNIPYLISTEDLVQDFIND